MDTVITERHDEHEDGDFLIVDPDQVISRECEEDDRLSSGTQTDGDIVRSTIRSVHDHKSSGSQTDGIIRSTIRYIRDRRSSGAQADCNVGDDQNVENRVKKIQTDSKNGPKDAGDFVADIYKFKSILFDTFTAFLHLNLVFAIYLLSIALTVFYHGYMTSPAFREYAEPYSWMTNALFFLSAFWVSVYVYQCHRLFKAVRGLLDACKSTITSIEEHESGAGHLEQEKVTTADSIGDADGRNASPHEQQIIESSPPQSPEEGDKPVTDSTKDPDPSMDETRSEASQGDVGK